VVQYVVAELLARWTEIREPAQYMFTVARRYVGRARREGGRFTGAPAPPGVEADDQGDLDRLDARQMVYPLSRWSSVVPVKLPTGFKGVMTRQVLLRIRRCDVDPFGGCTKRWEVGSCLGDSDREDSNRAVGGAREGVSRLLHARVLPSRRFPGYPDYDEEAAPVVGVGCGGVDRSNRHT
jgi:hypothetical protein